MEKMYVGDKFIGTKIINAVPCDAWEREGDYGIGAPGYKVTYDNGYETWSPKDVFEQTYRPIQNMTFGLAIEAMRKGLKVARSEWNGEDQWVATIRNPNDGSEMQRPYFYLSPVDGQTIIPWVPCVNDILSEDWMIVQ